MAKPDHPSLQIPEDDAFHRREWASMQLVWAGLLALMIATGAGAFGGGPVSHARAGEAGGTLWVDYDRIVRFGSPVRIAIHVQPDSNGTIRFSLDRALLEGFQVSHMTPEPAAARPDGAGTEYEFAAGAGRGPRQVIVDLMPSARWEVRGTIRSAGATVSLPQFVLP